MDLCVSSDCAGRVSENTPTGARSLELERRVGNMTNYPLGDYLIQIKNAARAGRKEVVVKNSKLIGSVAQALVKARFLDSAKEEAGELTCHLAYHKKSPVLVDLKLVSKPGLRKYVNAAQLAGRKRKKASMLLVSTPLGVMGSDEAQKKRVGGEVIAEVW